MTIAGVLGSGVLILPEVTARLAGPAAIVAWAIMALMALPMAWTFGRLAVVRPDAGGIASYVRRAFGPRAGRMVGILYLGTVPVAAPAAALIGAGYLGALLNWSHIDVVVVAGSLLTLALVVNLVGIEWSGWAATALVLAISLLLLAAVASALPHIQAGSYTPFWPHGWWPVGQSIALLYWAFVGWEMIGHLAEEFVNPQRDIPRALGLAVGVIAILYLSVSAVTIGTETYRTGLGDAGLARLIGLGLGRAGRVATTILALLITYGTMHTYIAGFSRLVYAQAREGDLPRCFAVLHARWRTPFRVFLALTVPFTVILGVSAFFQVSLASLIVWPSAVFIVLYILAMASAWRIVPNHQGRLATFLSGLVSVLALAFVGWAVVLPLTLMAAGWWLLPIHKGQGQEQIKTTVS